jgi:hypothetical protein
MKLEIVSATRKDETFWAQSALGLSSRRLAFDRAARVHDLGQQQQRACRHVQFEITARDGADVLVFAHDDVWLDDCFIVEHVAEGLNAFDLIGVVGNRRRTPKQPGWAFLERAPNGEWRWDDAANLSGAIAHGAMSFGPVVNYGPGGRCELLDGVLLAAAVAAGGCGSALRPGLTIPPL